MLEFYHEKWGKTMEECENSHEYYYIYMKDVDSNKRSEFKPWMLPLKHECLTSSRHPE
jgi:hypothetical protein